MSARAARNVAAGFAALAIAASAAARDGGERERLTSLGALVSRGAAPGYVEDRACATCHPAIAETYREVGMARSFARPRADVLIEDFEHADFFHEPSQRHYRMSWRDGRLIFERYQLADDGAPINRIELPVAWIMGSGHTSRVYFYRTPSGELFQLPIAWYSQTGTWGMAPGYDRAEHFGLSKQIRRECMFCHNAYPDVPAGSDRHRSAQTFPDDLPEGTGCQRCHGPGAEHVRIGLGRDGETIDFRALRASIVNPGRLEPERRDDVCNGCHLQPTVAFPGIRRLGRGDYSFRPGEPLEDYLLELDIDEPGRALGDRFEINHHAYRLRQSPCWIESQGKGIGGGLSCLTCHDPHRKVPPEDRARHYREACLTCHTLDQCRIETMAAGSAVDPGDCVTCHMPRRRTEDVVQVVMTDHRIRRRPAGVELLAPLAERDPQIDDLRFYDPGRAPSGALADVYRTIAVIRAGGGNNAAAVAALERLLSQGTPPPLEVYFDLASGQLGQRRYVAADRTLGLLLERSPDHPLALEWRGLVRNALGERDDAVALLRRAIARATASADESARDEARFNLGAILVGDERFAAAVPWLEEVVAARPTLASAWFYLGIAYNGLHEPEKALRGFRRSLEIEPGEARAYLALGRLLELVGRRDEALRFLRHGARHAAHPEKVAVALAELEAE